MGDVVTVERSESAGTNFLLPGHFVEHRFTPIPGTIRAAAVGHLESERPKMSLPGPQFWDPEEHGGRRDPSATSLCGMTGHATSDFNPPSEGSLEEARGRKS